MLHKRVSSAVYKATFSKSSFINIIFEHFLQYCNDKQPSLSGNEVTIVDEDGREFLDIVLMMNEIVLNDAYVKVKPSQ